MKFNVYRVTDKIKNREVRIFFAETDGSAARDQIGFDVRSEQNPAGLPFQDIQYSQIATYDSELHLFENVTERVIDIEKSYRFRHPEKEMKKEEVSPEKLEKFVKEGD